MFSLESEADLSFPIHASGTPSGVKYSEVRDGLLAVKGVTAVHNLHIWALTVNQAMLSAHVAIGKKELGGKMLLDGFFINLDVINNIVSNHIHRL